MEIPGIKEYKNFKENTVKDVRNLFRLNKSVKETNYAASKGIRKLFRLEKEKKIIKNRIIKDISNLFGYDE